MRQHHHLTCSFACLIKPWTRSRWGRLMRAPIRVSSRSGSPTLIFWVRFTTSFVKTSSIFLSTNTRVPLQHTWDTRQAAQNKTHITPQFFPCLSPATEALRKAPPQLLKQLTCPWEQRLDYPAAHDCTAQSMLDTVVLMPPGGKNTSSHQQERTSAALSVPRDDPSKPICQQDHMKPAAHMEIPNLGQRTEPHGAVAQHTRLEPAAHPEDTRTASSDLCAPDWSPVHSSSCWRGSTSGKDRASAKSRSAEVPCTGFCKGILSDPL